MDRLLGMSGHLVEDLLELARANDMSAGDLWLMASLSHVMLGDLLFPHDARAAYDGMQAASATFKAIVHPPVEPTS